MFHETHADLHVNYTRYISCNTQCKIHMRHVMAVQWECHISCHMFPWINIELLFCSLIYCENYLGDESLWTESIILSLYVGNKLHKWETIMILVQKHIKWAKKCISSWNFRTSLVGDSFNWDMYVDHGRQFWFSIILSSWVVKFLQWGHLKWVFLYIIIYLKSVASSVFSRGVFETNLLHSNGSIIHFFRIIHSYWFFFFMYSRTCMRTHYPSRNMNNGWHCALYSSSNNHFGH